MIQKEARSKQVSQKIKRIIKFEYITSNKNTKAVF